jgi:hypothetical protein
MLPARLGGLARARLMRSLLDVLMGLICVVPSNAVLQTQKS